MVKTSFMGCPFYNHCWEGKNERLWVVMDIEKATQYFVCGSCLGRLKRSSAQATVITQSGHVVVVSGLVLTIAYGAMLVLPGAGFFFSVLMAGLGQSGTLEFYRFMLPWLEKWNWGHRKVECSNFAPANFEWGALTGCFRTESFLLAPSAHQSRERERASGFVFTGTKPPQAPSRRSL